MTTGEIIFYSAKHSAVPIRPYADSSEAVTLCHGLKLEFPDDRFNTTCLRDIALSQGWGQIVPHLWLETADCVQRFNNQGNQGVARI